MSRKKKGAPKAKRATVASKAGTAIALLAARVRELEDKAVARVTRDALAFNFRRALAIVVRCNDQLAEANRQVEVTYRAYMASYAPEATVYALPSPAERDDLDV